MMNSEVMEKYPNTKKFLEYCEKGEFRVHDFVVPAASEDQPKDEHKTLVIEVYKFPFNMSFVGLKFSINDIKFEEVEGDQARVDINYSIVDNPNNLDLSVDKEIDTAPKDSDDDQLFVALISKVIEQSLMDMSKRFEEENNNKEETVSE